MEQGRRNHPLPTQLQRNHPTITKTLVQIIWYKSKLHNHIQGSRLTFCTGCTSRINTRNIEGRGNAGSFRANEWRNAVGLRGIESEEIWRRANAIEWGEKQGVLQQIGKCEEF